MTSRSRRRAGVAVAFIISALSVTGGGGGHIALRARAATPPAATGNPCDRVRLNVGFLWQFISNHNVKDNRTAIGMGHCAGGTGTTSFGNQGSPPPIVDAKDDCLSALDRWVEKGIAPDYLIASRVVNRVSSRTLPLCPYPKKAVYKGTGSTDEAANFVCR